MPSRSWKGRHESVRRLMMYVCVIGLMFLVPIRASAASTTLRVICFQGAAAAEALQIKSDEYMRQNPEVNIILDVTPFSTMREKMVIDFVGGTGRYDVVYVPTSWMPEFKKSGFLHPLNPYLDKDPVDGWPNDYPRTLLDPLFDEQGNILGIPIHDGPLMFYYRKDLFSDPKLKQQFKAEYGYELLPPINWNQFLDISRFFTKAYNPNSPTEYGTVVAAKQGGQQLPYEFFLLLKSHGGEILDENLKPVFNSDIGVKALKYLISLINEHKVVPPGVTTYDQQESGQYYLDGKCAMHWNWSHIAAYAELAEKSRIVGKNAWSAIPTARPDGKHVSQAGHWNWSISEQSKNKEEAYKLLKFLVSPDADKLVGLTGGISCRISNHNDAEMLEKFPFYAEITKLLQEGAIYYAPPIAEYAQLADILSFALSEAIAGSKDPREALDKAANDVENMMRKAGYYK